MALFNPMALVAMAQRRRVIRWLLGLHNFSLLPPGMGGAVGGVGMPGAGSPPRPVGPPPDPVRRLKVRMITTLTGILALALTVLVLCIAGISAAFGGVHAAGRMMVFGGAVMFVVAGWTLVRSMANRMPTPGVLIITLICDVLAVAGGIAILLK